MKIASPAFADSQNIPAKFTCDGENVSPPLQIADSPAGTKSLALVMDDPDIPDFVKQKFGIAVFDHWIAFNIPPTTQQIAAGQQIGTCGKNSSGKAEYAGPCPPDREHRYFFKIYALDTLLDLPEGADKAGLENAMASHILGQARLIGLYSRSK